MLPGQYDIVIPAGTDFELAWVWSYQSKVFDLTGWTARMQFRRRVESEDAELELTTENDGLTIDGPAGKITLVISATDTASLSGRYVYDLELIDTADKVTRLLSGYVTVSPEVTR